MLFSSLREENMNANSNVFPAPTGSRHGDDYYSVTSIESPLAGDSSAPLGNNDTPIPFSKTLSSIASYEQVKRTNQMPDDHLKIVVVGDGAVGKTCLLISYVQNTFPVDYIPTVFENYVTRIQGPKNKIIELALWDTAGQEEYSRLRPLSYSEVDMLLVCYAANNRTSLRNVQDLWYPEVKHFCPDVPIILVGLKSDLYDEEDSKDMVDPKAAESLASKLKAFSHIQCSAKTRDNVDLIFATAVSALIRDSSYEPKDNSSRTKSRFKKINYIGKGVRRHKCILF